MTSPTSPRASPSLSELTRGTLRLLTFRSTYDELLALGPRHLIFGLVVTWLAGMGRYWDHPRPLLVQSLGAGSLIYVFALALLLWLIVLPFKPLGWTYARVLTFITLVSPPALLYAIPVERFMALEAAKGWNVAFLSVVATWRVLLLVFFFRRFAQLRWGEALISAIFPLSLILVALALLNLEHVVFDVMAGLQDPSDPRGPAFGVVAGLAMLSFMLAPFLALAYAVTASVAWWRRSHSGGARLD